MNIANRQHLYIDNFKKKKALVVLPIYKDLHTFERVYRLKMYDYEKRDKQLSKKKRTDGWIYIRDSHIAKALNMASKDFTYLMKHILKAKYYKGIGLCFDTEVDCKRAIDIIYNKSLLIIDRGDV
jgi:hypothetical protein|nr:MAG TPA: hypothetical protein [Caudoviricetes sp.]